MTLGLGFILSPLFRAHARGGTSSMLVCPMVLQWNLKSGDISITILFALDCVGSLECFVFPYEFYGVFSGISVKTGTEISIEVT